jgi:formamidopyrimidine-DNA glycosylase
MPELPEVETIRRDLQPLVTGRKIVSAWVSENAPRLVQLMAPDEFERSLPGRTIEDVTRRGKYLVFNLSGGLLWVVHLRMTGRLRHQWTGCAGSDPYNRASFGLDDETWLCFNDLRKFGMMWLVDDWSLVKADIGPEPLEDGFDASAFRAALKRRSAPVKSVLLDQRVIAGVGNIYADEALFAAGIHPARAANSISGPKTARLQQAVIEVLQEALGDRGSSFSDYVDGKGNEGSHHLKVKVFRRTGEPCYVCGAEIQRIKVGGRSTHLCPRCQR